jgi:hypothetical protein
MFGRKTEKTEVERWKANMEQGREIPIVRLIGWLGSVIGMRSSEKPKFKSPSGNRALGRASTRELHKMMLFRLMRSMSEEYFAAGWMHGLELSLWHMALKGDSYEGQMLLMCAETAGGWWVWDDDRDENVFVPLPVWRQMYEQYAGEIAEPVR